MSFIIYLISNYWIDVLKDVIPLPIVQAWIFISKSTFQLGTSSVRFQLSPETHHFPHLSHNIVFLNKFDFEI